MITEAAVPQSLADFRELAGVLFPTAADEDLEKLYSMVTDLRALAARVSNCVLDDEPLSDTATGD